MNVRQHVELGFDRREFLGRIVYTVPALAAGARYLISPASASAQPQDPARLLDAISEALIPGSAQQRPGEFLLESLSHEFRGLTLAHIVAVARALNERTRGAFAGTAPPQRAATLALLDRDVFSQKAGKDLDVAWKTLKLALLSVYYTSEKGASGDLAYVLVPGRWQPDISLKDQPRALWSDTFARWYT